MSKPEDIPQDIVIKAAAVVVMFPPFPSIKAAGEAVDRVARAILAEREACESIARKHTSVDRSDPARFTAGNIAAAIRNRTATQETR